MKSYYQECLWFTPLDMTLVGASGPAPVGSRLYTGSPLGPVSLYTAQGVAYLGASSFVHGSDVLADQTNTDVFPRTESYYREFRSFPPQSIV